MSDAAPTPIPPHLPPDLARVWQSYVDMFGAMPPMPAGKFNFSGKVAPDFLRSVEDLRARAFYNTALGPKHSQLVLFALLLSQLHPAAAHHAQAARRAGASWDELHAIVELTTAIGALAPANFGGNMLNTLKRDEGA